MKSELNKILYQIHTNIKDPVEISISNESRDDLKSIGKKYNLYSYEQIIDHLIYIESQY